MRINRCLTILVICIAFAASGFAQGKEITEDQYLVPWRTARQKARGLTRRVIQTVTNHEKEMPDIDEWQYVYVMPDKVHYTNIRTLDGKVNRIEQIVIGKTKYGKKDGGIWKLSESYCIGGSGSGGPSNIASNKYYLENKKIDGKEIKVFRNYITYTNIYSPTKATEGLTFEESIFWLNSDDLMIREEIRKGLVNLGKVRTTNLTLYTYDPNLKIEAPIK